MKKNASKSSLANCFNIFIANGKQQMKRYPEQASLSRSIQNQSLLFKVTNSNPPWDLRKHHYIFHPLVSGFRLTPVTDQFSPLWAVGTPGLKGFTESLRLFTACHQQQLQQKQQKGLSNIHVAVCSKNGQLDIKRHGHTKRVYGQIFPVLFVWCHYAAW